MNTFVEKVVHSVVSNLDTTDKTVQSIAHVLYLITGIASCISIAWAMCLAILFAVCWWSFSPTEDAVLVLGTALSVMAAYYNACLAVSLNSIPYRKTAKE